MKGLREHRHLVLLLVLVLALLAHPLTGGTAVGSFVFDALMTVVLLTVFLIIFRRKWERLAALILVAPAVVSNWAGYALSGEPRTVALVLNHCLLVAFLGFTVAVILRGLFEQEDDKGDAIAGAVSGYLLAGVAWGHLYVLAWLFAPGSFKVNQEIAWQLADEYSRRTLFNFFSFATLATLGYGDITPVASVTCMLTWVEAMFGQFYIAVVVAQMVGLRLAQREKGETTGPTTQG
jgi:hypothetical protein